MNNRADYLESTVHLLLILDLQIAKAEEEGTGNDPFIKDMKERAKELEAFVKRTLH